ncbi:hypothetical protein JFT66_16835 [Pseudomonas sp. MF6755]|uniref:hypothetical protein n=1 Tax=Pseudomonas sp. MF6755 TaxID=2797530 RepID=UPI0018E77FBB|nr:hypothetical protein [Pseudomonas sp. MF6755]MBJ2285825.1 hypothetical protein [Pseudomonas sp. MF6755]
MSGKPVTSAWESDQGVDATFPISIQRPERQQQEELLAINAMDAHRKLQDRTMANATTFI